MEKPVVVTARNVTLDPRTEKIIHRRAAKLERYYPRLVGCSVVVEGLSGRKSGGPFRLQIDMRVPGGDPLIVNRRKSETIELAVKEAFDAAERAIDEFGRQQRGEVKRSASSG